MTIAQILKKHAEIEADLLLGHVLKQSKEFLYMNPTKKLTLKQKSAFDLFVKKRKAGIPVAYLTGYKYFYGLKFKVNRNVLIPRPETEWLVEETLRLITAKLKGKPKAALRILDVGTGSGCIAISIAKNVNSKRVKVFATDISKKVLAVALMNAKLNNAKVNFSQHDLLKGVKGQFDIIIANLPYVPISDYNKILGALKYEPKLALTDGTDTYPLISEFLHQVKPKLKPNGIVLLEFDPKTPHYLKAYKPMVIKDFRGLKRFAKIIKKPQA